MLVDRLPLIGEAARLESALYAHVVRARGAALRMNFASADTLLGRAENLGRTRDWGRLCAAVALERVWLRLREGRISEAVAAHEQLDHLADKYQASIDFAWSDIHRYAALSRAYLASAQRHFDDAISTLKALKDDAARVQNH